MPRECPASGTNTPRISPMLRRRRWSVSELRYLQARVGIRTVEQLSRALQRSERALRCKLHRLKLSAKVVEGWSLHELRVSLRMSVKQVLRHIVAGHLRVQCAQLHGVEITDDSKAAPHSGWKRVCAEVLRGRWRLSRLRISEASVQRFHAISAQPVFPP